jgi:hypothetical protein
MPMQLSDHLLGVADTANTAVISIQEAEEMTAAPADPPPDEGSTDTARHALRAVTTTILTELPCPI